MLRLEDRMRIALGANMGFQVLPSEVEDVARMLVVLRQIHEGCEKASDRGGALGKLVRSALEPFTEDGDQGKACQHPDVAFFLWPSWTNASASKRQSWVETV